MNRQPLLSVVVPARDEAMVLPEFHEQLSAVLAGLDVRAEILYVDDGSTDGTWEVMAGLAERDARVRAVRLSRSFGHQAALSAGIDRASGDAVVTIDADLQDPPELIPTLVAKWREGFAVVHARRTRRLGEGWAKRTASFLFHRLLRLVADIPIRVDTADFRLLDRSACNLLRSLPERRRYLRGLAVWTGLPQAEVPYERQPRFAGRTKYRWRNMISLGLDAIVSFSRVPLKMAAWLGAAVLPSSLALLVVGIVRASSGKPGRWIIPVALLALLDGVVLLLLGVLGAYVARVGDEARARPLYVVQQETEGSTKRRAVGVRSVRKRRGASGGSARSARRT
jgi:glycosyltransferase involved in cell wall biosynthesis